MEARNRLKNIPLANTTKFIVDNRGKTAPTAPTGIPLIATNCISNDRLYPAYENLRYVSEETYSNWFRSHPIPGDIILTNKGSQNGAICLVPDPVDFVIAQDMVALRADESIIDPLYLFAALRSPDVQRQIKTLDVSGVIPHLKKSDFDKLYLPYPERRTQEAIGQIYHDFCLKIELNRRMNATLESMAKALFQSWFVDFDPVRAKMDGHKPAAMDTETAGLFPDSFQESELGLIPKGWRVARLEQIASVMMGLSPNGESYNTQGDGTPLINGPVEYGDYFPVKAKWTTAATRFANKDDLIFCVRGSTTGRRVVSDGMYAIGRGVCAIRANEELHCFVHQTINWNLDRLLAKTTGSVFPSLAAPDIKGFLVVDPGTTLRTLHEQKSKDFLAAIKCNCNESRTLATLRDTLLPKLLSGELSVKLAEKLVGEAT